MRYPESIRMFVHMARNSKKTARLELLLNRSLKEQWAAAAREEDLTVSQWLRRAGNRALVEQRKREKQ